MEGLFLQILNMSVSASWLILAVILIRLLLGKAPKGLRYVLWALVGIRLLCPVFIESDFSLIPSAETFEEESVNSDKPEIHSGVAFLDEIINPVLPTTPNVPSVENVVGNDAAQDDLLQHGSAQNNAMQDDVTSEESISPMIMLSWVWLIGILGMLGYALISYMRLRKTVKPSMQLEDNLWVCDEIQSPFIMGLVNPRIYMPSYVGEEHKPYIVAHEMEHLRYRDHWWKPLGFAILAIHWFNPLVWMAYILMCRDIELACDERVIQVMGVEEKKNYSKSLLLCSTPRHFISACPVAFGEVGVKERIKRIVDYKKPAVWAAGLGIVVCVVIAICFMTNPKEVPSDNTEGTEGTEETEVEQVEVGPIDEATLKWFETEFFNNNENLIVNMFLTSEYNSPADIDLHHVFYGGATGMSTNVSQDEIRLLEQKYDTVIELDVAKVTRKEMDQILKKYIGLKRKETNQINLNNLYYLEEYDAFYNLVGNALGNTIGGMIVPGYVIIEGVRNENGTITLQYYDAFSSYKRVSEVTLREKDGNYYFVSNVIIKKLVNVDVGVSDEELTPMQKVLFNKMAFSSDCWIGDIEGIYWSVYRDDYRKYVQFFNVDLDHDGVDEVCVEYASGHILILHEEDNAVYGYPFEYRPFHPVYKDGTFCGSSSAALGDFNGNVSFEKDAFSFEIITSTEYETDGSVHYYKAGHQYGGEGAGIEITKEEYDEIMSNYAMEEVERYDFIIDNILKYVD